jgi:cell division protein FtsB
MRDIKLLEKFKQQSEEIALLKAHISILTNRISALEEENRLLKQKKNSGNSSTPPSQDPFRAKRTTS